MPILEAEEAQIEEDPPVVLYTVPGHMSEGVSLNNIEIEFHFNKAVFPVKQNGQKKTMEADQSIGSMSSSAGGSFSLGEDSDTHFLTITDCGVDGLCEEEPGFGDNQEYKVFLNDRSQVKFDANVVIVKPGNPASIGSAGIRFRGNRDYTVRLTSGIEDAYGNKIDVSKYDALTIATGGAGEAAVVSSNANYFGQMPYILQFKTGPEQISPVAWRISAITESRWTDNPFWAPLEINLTNGSFTKSGEGWRLSELKMYSGTSCDTTILSGTPFASGQREKQVIN